MSRDEKKKPAMSLKEKRKVRKELIKDVSVKARKRRG